MVSSVTTPNPGTPGGSAQTTLTFYDQMLQATNVVNPDGTGVTNEFYLTGELKRNYGARAYPTGYGYDYAGRISTMTNWSGFSSGAGTRVTAWSYDKYRGWLTNKTYGGGAAGPIYSNTPAGRPSKRTWARGVTTTYLYDAVGQLSSVFYSDSTAGVTNAYDRMGRVIQTTVGTNLTTSFAYDLASELLSETYTAGILNGATVTNAYDGFMRRTAAGLSTQPSTLVQFGYDNASRLGTVTQPLAVNSQPISATYAYLANSPLVSQITFRSNSTTRMVTSKQYDLLNRLTNIVSSTNSVAVASFKYTYNNANQRIGVTNVDGSYWVYTYDSLGQVTSGKKYWSDNSAVAGQQFTYTFDDIGNRTQTQSGGDNSGLNLHTANYHANLLNQYTNRDVAGYVQMLGTALTTDSILLWGNDPAVGGSATTFGAATRKGTYFWGEQNWDNSSVPRWLSLSAFGTAVSGGVTNIAGASGSFYLPQTPEVFRYDADGNLTNDGRWVYTWDGENRLIRMQGMSGIPDAANLKLEFRYDSQSRRIQKEVYAWYPYLGAYQLTGRTRFVYDGWNLVSELNGTSNNALVRCYMWGLDLSGSPQGAGGVGGLLAINDRLTINNQPSAHFIAYDGSGNVAALVNAADSTVSARYEFGPFGEVRRATGPLAKASPFRFSTKYYDDETDLLYYGYRYYEPSTGRWLSRDPIEERGGLNVFGLPNNDLINKIDAKGLSQIFIVYQNAEAETIYFPSLKKLKAALQKAINSGNLIDQLYIKGHGEPKTMWINRGGLASRLFGWGDYLEVHNGRFIQGGSSDGSEDVTWLFRSALTRTALVVLNGCETGRGTNSIAQQMSVLLPGRTVGGGQGLYQVGCPFSSCKVVGKKNYFINGVLVHASWDMWWYWW